MIDESTIKNMYNECLAHAKSLIDVSKWTHQPTGIQLDTHKSKYGQATPDGLVLINTAFIGTDAINKLKETILHELAHLIVGLKHHHSRLFRNWEAILLKGVVVNESERNEVKNNNGYKHRLLAICENTVHDLGGAFRRTKKFRDYQPTDNRFISVDGDKVIRFEYVPFDQELPPTEK